MIVSVFVRRLKPGATFQDFVREWEADAGFGVPTRVFNAQSLTDPREVISIGFVAVTPEQVAQWLSTAPASEAVRHERIDTVIESTTLRRMYELGTEQTSRTCPSRSTSGLRQACWPHWQPMSSPLARQAPLAWKAGLPASRDDPPAPSRPS
jgi:hypothetical protein